MIDLSHLPPASQNNHRSIAREALARFNRNKSDLHRNKVEALTGIDGDWSDKDADFFEPKTNQQ